MAHCAAYKQLRIVSIVYCFTIRSDIRAASKPGSVVFNFAFDGGCRRQEHGRNLRAIPKHVRPSELFGQRRIQQQSRQGCTPVERVRVDSRPCLHACCTGLRSPGAVDQHQHPSLPLRQGYVFIYDQLSVEQQKHLAAHNSLRCRCNGIACNHVTALPALATVNLPNGT